MKIKLSLFAICVLTPILSLLSCKPAETPGNGEEKVQVDSTQKDHTYANDSTKEKIAPAVDKNINNNK